MNARYLVAAAPIALFASPAFAGETVIYAPAQEWVEPPDLGDLDLKDDPAQLVYDTQYRMEDGIVTSYQDVVVRIDNPEMLTQNGTISLTWLPDKGDLMVHRVEILRDGETIDLIDGKDVFEVIRREQGLEQRLLDGQLTATLAVPGLKLGDVLRVTHSTTTDDQALGDEMQVIQYLPQKPWQAAFSRVLVSWPEKQEMFFGAEDIVDLPEITVNDGYRTLSLQLPIAKLPEMPGDAPSRYRRHPFLRVGTFADWTEMSRVFAPHYSEAAAVDKGGEVAKLAERIMGETDDPLDRTARALRIVQDDVSYLLNGLDGGNYMPQSASQTWELRYGDCKAKSVLLTALLRQMDIDATPVLVTTGGGDAVPELLPIPAAFNHMLVRATIEGTDYWLDGTNTASRLSNIGDVPPFFYALPLVADGSGLVPMIQRLPQSPGSVVTVTSDYSAGLDLPALFDMTIEVFGPQGAGLRAAADEANEDKLKEMAKGFANSSGSGGAITSISVTYDEDAAVGKIALSGVMPSAFKWEDGRLRLEPDANERIEFNPDRARSEWSAIPVQTPGTMRSRLVASLILPEAANTYEITGPANANYDFANTKLASTTRLTGNRMIGSVDVSRMLGEIPANEIGAQKLEVRRINAIESELLAPEEFKWRWEVEPRELASRAKPLIAAYDNAVAFAADDDWGPLRQRASYYAQIFDWKAAVRDLDTLIENDRSTNLLVWRASLHDALGDTDAAIADARTAYDLDPSTDTALYLAELLAYDGQPDAALQMLESLPVSDDEQGSYVSTYATVAGLAGQSDAALEALSEQVSRKPTDASVLNAMCWYRGLFDVDTASALPVCTKAVERANYGAQMLDSRAMVHYRNGDHASAIKDLDSALELSPSLAASLYLRGIVRLEEGDTAGRQDVTQALRLSPELAARYAKHGLVPPN